MTLHIAAGMASPDSYRRSETAAGHAHDESPDGLASAEQGLAVTRIAAEALGTVQQILQRMHTVVGHAATQDARSVVEISAAEIATLNSLLDYIAGQTTYRSVNLLDGSYQASFQVGSGAVIGAGLIELDLRNAGVSARALGASSLAITATDGSSYQPTADLNSLDAAIAMVSATRSALGSVRGRLEDAISDLETAITNVGAARTQLTDADLADEVTGTTRSHLTLLR